MVAYPENDPFAAATGSRYHPLPHSYDLAISTVAEMLQPEKPEYEVRALICVHCGQGGWWGSGNYVNRIPVCDTVEENRECERNYPWGTHTCDSCECKYWEELAADGEACAEHQCLLVNGKCEVCEEERTESQLAA